MLLFTITMPHVGSWNGKWSGESKEFTKLVDERRCKNVEEGSYFYDFGDGWTARVSVTKVPSRDAAKIRRRSAGFMGYDWMIDSIIQSGEITTGERRNNDI